MTNRSRAQRGRIKRAAAARAASQAIATETTQTTLVPAVEPRGSGGLLCDSRHVRSDLQLVRQYLQSGVFSADEIDAMLRRIGAIVQTGSPRESVAAFKCLASAAKLAMSASAEPQQHAHLHVESSNSDDLADIAAEIGISIQVVEADED